MKEPAEIATPGKLAKAEEVIAEYVQRYGFTPSARAYFGPSTEGVRNEHTSKTTSRSTEAAVIQEHEEKVESTIKQGYECLGTGENDELHRLRCELKEMREERDLLAKAAAWFARNEMP